MIVYRMAREQAGAKYPIGPYQWKDSEGNRIPIMVHMSDVHSDDYIDHPLPQASSIYMMPEEVCGFNSLEQLTNWFGDWFDELSECGFLLHTYDVLEEYVQETPEQVVFDITQATLLDAEPLAFE